VILNVFDMTQGVQAISGVERAVSAGLFDAKRLVAEAIVEGPSQ